MDCFSISEKPQTDSPESSADKDVHLNYFFIECKNGKPWESPGSTPEKGLEREREQMKHFIGGFARLQVKLSKAVFTAIGSLYPGEGKASGPRVGPLVCASFFSKGESPFFFGPFKTNRERYLAHINFTLDNILDDQLFDEDPLTALLIHLEAKSLVEQSEELGREEHEFYVKHGDDKGDQFLVDENVNNLVFVDWEL